MHDSAPRSETRMQFPYMFPHMHVAPVPEEWGPKIAVWSVRKSLATQLGNWSKFGLPEEP